MNIYWVKAVPTSSCVSSNFCSTSSISFRLWATQSCKTNIYV